MEMEINIFWGGTIFDLLFLPKNTRGEDILVPSRGGLEVERWSDKKKDILVNVCVRYEGTKY